MRYCRFLSAKGPEFGIVESLNGSDHVTHTMPGSDVPDFLAAQRRPPVSVETITVLAPVKPSKIICVGRNYSEHAKELGNEVPAEPLIFLKPPSSIIASGQSIVRPKSLSQRVDYEGERAVVIGRTCRSLSDSDDVRPFILGYTCANDVTARDLQKKDDQWSRAKGFDTFCPVGPIVTDEIDPWAGVRVETRVNGAVRQSESTTAFIFPLDVIVRFVSQVMTLLPGDLILTGTPSGIGPLVAGDQVEVSIEGVGALRNPVVDGN
jgi:2-keto-4-pentenoate hydratase/2-oxohepta-3-ene-1,7-dioic acid hydratase in catechol pathway